MDLDPLHLDITRIVLEATARYRAALGGGNALLAHGISARPTEDIDVFIANGELVSAASAAALDALEQHGYRVEEHAASGGLGDWWPEAWDGLAELEVSAPGSDRMVQVQASHFELLCPPVEMPGIGLVVAMDDAAGFKAAATAGRALERDFVDIASLTAAGYTAERLIALAMERDHGLPMFAFAEAARRLDRMEDSRLAPYLDADRDAGWVRAAFGDWPRDGEPPAGEEGDEVTWSWQ
ncbi:MAG: nucleotidyl transferase AbiEii/AbiGii toxin family protein [Trebonia sp.]|jgi:hypothetical protein